MPGLPMATSSLRSVWTSRPTEGSAEVRSVAEGSLQAGDAKRNPGKDAGWPDRTIPEVLQDTPLCLGLDTMNWHWRFPYPRSLRSFSGVFRHNDS